MVAKVSWKQLDHHQRHPLQGWEQIPFLQTQFRGPDCQTRAIQTFVSKATNRHISLDTLELYLAFLAPSELLYVMMRYRYDALSLLCAILGWTCSNLLLSCFHISQRYSGKTVALKLPHYIINVTQSSSHIAQLTQQTNKQSSWYSKKNVIYMFILCWMVNHHWWQCSHWE